MLYLTVLPRVLLTACLFSLSMQAAWAEQAPKTAITAITAVQRQQIQFVGQALLTARRQAKPSAQAIAIRQQLKQVKAQLDSLTVPLPVGTLRLNPISTLTSVKTVAKTANNRQSWQQRHGKQIAKLDTALAKLNEMTDEVSLQRTPPTVIKQATKPLSVWQQLKSKILKQPAISSPKNAGQNTARRTSIHTDLSVAALNQLKTLQVEINEAIAQADNQRPLALRALSKRLTLSKYHPVTHHQSRDSASHNKGDGGDESIAKTPTPTITSRTSHRREF